MLIQFKAVSDDSVWQVDTENLKWEHKNVETPFSGELIYQTGNVFSMAGRRPDTPAPGAGLCTLFTTTLAVGQEIIIFLRANVDIKDFTLVNPIKSVRYEILK